MGGMPVDATWDQDSFAWYEDDAAPNSATIIGSINTNPTTLVVDTPYLLGYLVQETAGSNQSETPRFDLEFRINQGGGFGSWQTVATNSSTVEPVRTHDSSNFTSGDSKNQRIGSGTMTDGEAYDSSGAGITMAATVGSDEYEPLWCVYFDSDNTTAAAEGDIVEFRLIVTDGNQNTNDAFTTNGGTYTRTTSITIASSGAYEMAAEAGDFDFTGQAVDLDYGRHLDAEDGSFAFTGQEVDFIHRYQLNAQSGSFAVSGQEADLDYGRNLVAEDGSFSITGQDTGLLYDRIFIADAGSFAFTGQDATLNKGVTMTAESGSFDFNGQAATLIGDFVMPANAGSFSLAGQAADLLYGRKIDSEAGSFALTGFDTGMIRGYPLTAETGAYAVSGQNADLLTNREVAADSGTFLFTGQEADLVLSQPKAETGSFLFTGQNVDLIATLIGEVIDMIDQSLTSTGQSGITNDVDEIDFSVSGTFVADWELQAQILGEWVNVRTGSAVDAEMGIKSARATNWRFNVPAYTSGTLVVKLQHA